jgi:hypothetical protein
MRNGFATTHCEIAIIDIVLFSFLFLLDAIPIRRVAFGACLQEQIAPFHCL